jgi:class 3 adenylate cyclase
VNPPAAKFCNECGTSLSGEVTGANPSRPVSLPAPGLASGAATPQVYTPPHLVDKIRTAKSALEGERKQVTVLFADLKGSMELLGERDPEEVRQLLDPVLERLMAAVRRYEGTVNQIMGDGIMALFGAPIAHEDHAVRACYAALAMQEAIRRYSAEVRRTHGVEVQIRVGLHSGEVVVRAIGNDLHMDYSAIGQTTHLAARMEQLAAPGSIRLTAETLWLAEGLVQVTALGPVPVKGLAEPVEVFELVGTSALRRRLQVAAARGLSPFVGRQPELAALQQALEQAGAGHGQVVALVGEAGVGKSRLVYEVIHSHRTQGWLVLESASVSYGKATPYFLVLDLTHTRTYKERGNEAYALHLLGEIAARREPPESDQAEAHYCQALALAEELGMRPLQAHCHCDLGTLYATRGQQGQACAALATAIDLYRDMEMTFWLPQAEAALALVE